VWKKLHTEELNLYSSPDVIRMMKSREWKERVARVAEERNIYKVLVRKPERKRQFERIRYRWECNIKMDLKDIGWEGVD
jgi:hypothetical protein